MMIRQRQSCYPSESESTTIHVLFESSFNSASPEGNFSHIWNVQSGPDGHLCTNQSKTADIHIQILGGIGKESRKWIKYKYIEVIQLKMSAYNRCPKKGNCFNLNPCKKITAASVLLCIGYIRLCRGISCQLSVDWCIWCSAPNKQLDKCKNVFCRIVKDCQYNMSDQIEWRRGPLSQSTHK